MGYSGNTVVYSDHAPGPIFVGTKVALYGGDQPLICLREMKSVQSGMGRGFVPGSNYCPFLAPVSWFSERVSRPRALNHKKYIAYHQSGRNRLCGDYPPVVF